MMTSPPEQKMSHLSTKTKVMDPGRKMAPKTRQLLGFGAVVALLVVTLSIFAIMQARRGKQMKSGASAVASTSSSKGQLSRATCDETDDAVERRVNHQVVNRPHPSYADPHGFGYGFYPADYYRYGYGDVMPSSLANWNPSGSLPYSTGFYYFPYYMNYYPSSYFYSGRRT